MNPFVQIIPFFSKQSLILESFFIQETVSKSINESSIFNLTNIIIFVLLGISLIINVLLLIMVKNRNRNLKIKNDSCEKYKGYFELEKVKTKRLETDLGTVQDHYSKMDTKGSISNRNNNDEQQSKVEFYKQRKNSSEQFEEYKEEKPKTKNWEIKKEEEIFLPSPFEDKRFTIEDVSKERTVSSLYKIVLNDNGITGKLLLLEDADFTRAFNSPDHYLEKACRFENVFNPNAKGIDVVSSGSVKLENQDWFVTEKIKIKFI